MRNMARIEIVRAVRPIPKADAIEVATIGGWNVVVKKDDAIQVGEPVVYIEIDAFLPEGNPAWQFLIDKQPRVWNGQTGHVLRTVTMRGQISQGFCLRPSTLGLDPTLPIGTNVAEALGIQKWEAPIPKELEGLARGMYPSGIPKTDQERIQNLPDQLEQWQLEADTWEVSEKLEGASTTFAWLDDDLHVCSRAVDYLDAPDNTLWQVAHRLSVPEKFAAELRGRQLAFQGELVGPGIEDNKYKLTEHRFYVYDVYDFQAGTYLAPQERYALVALLGLLHVPVLEPHYQLTTADTMDALLARAVGPSVLLEKQTREGLVYKRLDGRASFKTISNVYLK